MSTRDWFGGAGQQQRNAFEDTVPGQIAVQHGPRDRPGFEEAMKVLKARAVGMEKGMEFQAQVPEAARERTDATVSPTSAWAWEWLPVDGGRTRAAEDIVGKQ